MPSDATFMPTRLEELGITGRTYEEVLEQMAAAGFSAFA
jgi:hypothetical protein